MCIVLSLFTLYLFLVGYALAPFLRAKGRPFEQAALTISVGILIDYCLMLTGQSITRVFAAGLIAALWGALRLCRDVRIQAESGIREYKTPILSVCFIIYLLVIFYLQVLSEPLFHWDARSIWFFQAKMIWTDGALREHTGWNDPSLVFSNPDYPKLIPAIAAQIAYLKGYWNEFLPKGGLLVMLVPPILWVVSFRKKSVAFTLLPLTFFFSLGPWLWNGYMDGYLVLYCSAALLVFGRYLSEGRVTDLYSSMGALGIGASLKNEGLLFAVCFITAVLGLGVKYPELSFRQFARRIRTDSLFARVLLLSIAPTLMWTMCKMAWGLQYDLTRDPAASVSRLSSRLFDGVSPQYLFNFLFVRATAIWMVVGLLSVTILFSVRQKLELHRGALVAGMTAALYVSGLCLVYLSVPHDLYYYLSTGATRTMAAASTALLVSMFFLLSGLEVNEGQIEQADREPPTIQRA